MTARSRSGNSRAIEQWRKPWGEFTADPIADRWAAMLKTTAFIACRFAICSYRYRLEVTAAGEGWFVGWAFARVGSRLLPIKKNSACEVSQSPRCPCH